MDKINVGLYDKTVDVNQIIKNMEIKEIVYINLHLIDGSGMEFAAC